jgi:hypothetical protein
VRKIVEYFHVFGALEQIGYFRWGSALSSPFGGRLTGAQTFCITEDKAERLTYLEITINTDIIEQWSQFRIVRAGGEGLSSEPNGY